MKAHLQLKDYWIEDFRWKPVEKPSESPEPSDAVLPKVKVAVYQAEDGSDYLVQLQISLTQGQAFKAGMPYLFRLTITGLFKFLEGTSVDIQRRMIHVNGSSILYGISRGVLADATAHGRAGKYILPAINLIKLLERRGNLEGTVQPAIP